MNKKQKEENRIDFEEKFKLFYRKLNYIDLYREYKKLDSECKTKIYKEEIKQISDFYNIEINDSNLEYLLERKSILEDKLDVSRNRAKDTLSENMNIHYIILGFILGEFLKEDEMSSLLLIKIIIVMFFLIRHTTKHVPDSRNKYKKDSFLRSLIEYELELINKKVNNYIEDLLK